MVLDTESRNGGSGDPTPCPICGRACPSGSEFCIFCGAKMSEPVSVVKLCPKCGSENPDEATYCLKCGSPLSVHGPEDDEVMSKLSPLEQATTKGLSKEKCQRYRAPAIVLSLISGLLMLVMLFVVEVDLIYGPGAMIEVESHETLYHLITDLGAESRLSDGVLSALFWVSAMLAIIGLFIPFSAFFSGFVGFVMMMLMTGITVDVSFLEVNAEVPLGFPVAAMFVIMILSGIAAHCTNVYGIQFRERQGKHCIQEYIPLC